MPGLPGPEGPSRQEDWPEGPRHVGHVRSQGSVCPRDKLSRLPASQLRQAQKPLGATSTWVDGLTGSCRLKRHHGRCPSQAATPRLAGA